MKGMPRPPHGCWGWWEGSGEGREKEARLYIFFYVKSLHNSLKLWAVIKSFPCAGCLSALRRWGVAESGGMTLQRAVQQKPRCVSQRWAKNHQGRKDGFRAGWLIGRPGWRRTKADHVFVKFWFIRRSFPSQLKIRQPLEPSERRGNHGKNKHWDKICFK